MFGQTSFTINSKNTSPFDRKPARMQSPGSIRRSIPPKPSSATRRVSKESRDIEMSERFKNQAYNRQPSPVGRFLVPGRGRKDTSNLSTNGEASRSGRDRSPPKSAVTYGSVAECRSDVMRRRLEEQKAHAHQESRVTPTSPERMRPKTTEHRKTNDKPALLASPSFEGKVLLAVKAVLSRAVIEKGKIDVNNINNIIADMTNRLLVNENVSNDSEEETIPLDVSLKQSTTRLNIDPVLPGKNNTFLISKSKPLPGIIRKNIVEPVKKSQKIYKRIYNPEDSLNVEKKEGKQNTYEVLDNGYESTMYIDIPDSDYSNFNSLLKKEAELSRLVKQKRLDDAKREEDLALNKEQDNRVDSSFIERSVGDCNLEACPPNNFWKISEDIKLQNYIESLIRNMNSQLNGKRSNSVFSNQVETEQTVCKSFCVCKVCVSSKTLSSRKALNDDSTSISNIKRKSQLELKQRNSALNSSIIAANSSKLRQPKVFCKDANKESHFKILQRNANFQPESKLNLVSRYSMGHEVKHVPSSNGSYMMVAPEEASEDLYLQRRVNKAPVKRRMSTKI